MISMDPSKLAELRQRLERDRDSLRGEIAQMQGEDAAGNRYDAEFSGYGNHEADTATETYEQERDIALQGTLEKQMDEVEHALRKFEDGTYGVCDVCGKDINPERLEVFPQATLCLDDQQKAEAQGRV